MGRLVELLKQRVCFPLFAVLKQVYDSRPNKSSQALCFPSLMPSRELQRREVIRAFIKKRYFRHKTRPNDFRRNSPGFSVEVSTHS